MDRGRGSQVEGRRSDGWTKTEWRAHFKAIRAALTDAEYATHSTAICERLRALPEVQAARTVHCYWPLVERREVDTRPFVAACVAAEQRVVLPVVETLDGAPRMVHRVYEGEDHLVANRWGLHEPTGPLIQPADLDVVIVPAFGADRRGHRIGHGRGFYDAFLADTGALRVCVVYDACFMDRLPNEPHDIVANVLVTEHQTVSV
ncbi:MAG: 5-formyltetrahydrofolate cyclo-ligase [Bacteroidota bacterium]